MEDKKQLFSLKESKHKNLHYNNLLFENNSVTLHQDN